MERQDPSYAVALVLSTTHEILLIERAKRDGDHWSGHMAFPGGRTESSDQNLLHTAMRETKEEVSLHLSAENYISELLDIQLRKRGLPTPGSLSSFVFVVEKQDLQIEPSEVESAFWIPTSFFANPKNMDTYELDSGGVKISLPCINFQSKKIWGLTYHLLSHFFAAYGDATKEDYKHLVPLYIK